MSNWRCRMCGEKFNIGTVDNICTVCWGKAEKMEDDPHDEMSPPLFVSRRGATPKPHKTKHERIQDEAWEDYMADLTRDEGPPFWLGLTFALVLLVIIGLTLGVFIVGGMWAWGAWFDG